MMLDKHDGSEHEEHEEHNFVISFVIKQGLYIKGWNTSPYRRYETFPNSKPFYLYRNLSLQFAMTSDPFLSKKYGQSDHI